MKKKGNKKMFVLFEQTIMNRLKTQNLSQEDLKFSIDDPKEIETDLIIKEYDEKDRYGNNKRLF